MSDAQVLFLEDLINKKYHESNTSLRKLVAHRGLFMRLLPFAIESNEILHRSEAESEQTMKEKQDRLAPRRAICMKSFEDNIAFRLLIEKFAALTLDNTENR
jgi:hypothetical protein